jgi:hypothetical protein
MLNDVGPKPLMSKGYGNPEFKKNRGGIISFYIHQAEKKDIFKRFGKIVSSC